MESGQDFIDHYAVLQVTPTCDAKILEKAYRHFAQKYHPDHAETADVDKFQEVINAYDVLRDPEQRAEYDQAYRLYRKDNFHRVVFDEEIVVDERSAASDAEAHMKMLYYLYKRRREHADEPGIASFFVQQLLDCSDETFEFHSWYLKSKGLISSNQQGELQITVEGVDHVISMSREKEAEKLLIAKDPSAGEAARRAG